VATRSKVGCEKEIEEPLQLEWEGLGSVVVEVRVRVDVVGFQSAGVRAMFKVAKKVRLSEC
jgi:hypothetical protein